MTNYIVKRCIFWNIFWKRNITVNGFWVDNRGNYQFCKIICFNQGHANFFSDFYLCGNLTIVKYKLLEMNFQLFCKNGHQLVISSFLSFSFLFLFFAFLTLVEGCCAKTKFISPYVFCFYKWRHHINVALHALPYKMFSSNS